MRAVLYAVLFAAVAWLQWHGPWIWVLTGLIMIEIGLTLWDFVVEDRTRRLSATERVTHTVLAMNGGAYVVLLLVEMFSRWRLQPAGLQTVHYGWISWVLSVYAVGVLLSGLRDGLAAAALRQQSARQ